MSAILEIGVISAAVPVKKHPSKFASSFGDIFLSLTFIFLDIAISSLKNNGVIHYYSHIHAEKKQDAPKLSEEHFLNINKIQAKIMTSRVVRPVGPRFYQTVVDVKIQKN